jgi:hypothetical protein
MAENRDADGRFWPYMILGFLFIGITLGYWTVKHAVDTPVHESNEYMMKYQRADRNADKIVEAQKRFDEKYEVSIVGIEYSDFKPEHLKRKVDSVVALKRRNDIGFRVTDRDGKAVTDANVTLLLTRPHTRSEDRLYSDIPYADGIYRVEGVEVKKPGRYILRLRVSIGDAVGFVDTEGYLKP